MASSAPRLLLQAQDTEERKRALLSVIPRLQSAESAFKRKVPLKQPQVYSSTYGFIG